MTWLTWRQHRIEILIMGVILLALTVILLVTGIQTSLDVHRLNICLKNPQANCFVAERTVSNDMGQIIENTALKILLFALPLLTGMFTGTYAIARELEQGTYRMIWTQGIPWNRWLLRKLGLLICLVLCAFGILFGLLAWWASSSNALQLSGSFGFAERFDAWGEVIVAYAIFAFMLGIFAGTVIRKTVPAMAITLVIFIAIRVLIVNFLRPYYLPPIVLTAPPLVSNNAASSDITHYSWVIEYTIINRQGQPQSIDALAACEQLLGNATDAERARYNQCVTERGLQQRFVYQPGDRFWLFQGIESGIYLLLTALLFALTFWWTKHRILRA